MKTTKILRLWISAAVILGCSTGLTLSAEPTALHEVKIGYTSRAPVFFPSNSLAARVFSVRRD
jgi:hypothetical protein